jgi:hypothetical protein
MLLVMVVGEASIIKLHFAAALPDASSMGRDIGESLAAAFPETGRAPPLGMATRSPTEAAYLLAFLLGLDLLLLLRRWLSGLGCRELSRLQGIRHQEVFLGTLPKLLFNCRIGDGPRPQQ